MAFTGEPAEEKSDGAFEAALANAKRGKSDGYRSLFDSYNRTVAAVALAEGSPDPDETVNAVFLKAFRSIDRFVGGHANFASFLYQITRFQITDERRARNRSGEEDEFEQTETAAKTNEALHALTAEHREVLVLRIFFDLTGPEAAEALDKPVSAVRSLQNRAEARLRAKAEAGSVML